MCGRTACALAPDDIVKACSYRDGTRKRKCPSWVEAPGGKQYTPAYNLAPGAYTPVLLSAKHLSGTTYPVKYDSPCGTCDRVVMPMKWGLTPPWHQGDPYKVPYETNNCRAEGMLEKKTFKVPLQRGNRCVILADGFFEWKSSKDGKQPYYFYFPQKHSKTSEIKEETKEKFVKEEHSLNSNFTSFWDTNVKPHSSNLSHEDKTKLDVSFTRDQNSCSLSKTMHSGLARTVTHDDKEHVMAEEVHCTPLCVKQEVYGEISCHESNDENEIPEDAAASEGKKLLTMAGVFDVWKADQSSPPLFSYSVITVSSSRDMDWCHHRMPAILSSAEEVASWLDSSAVPLSQAVSLIKPKVCLTHHAVSKQVNNSRYQAPDCIKPFHIGQNLSNPGCKLMQKWLQSASPGKRKPEDTDSKRNRVPDTSTSPKKARQSGGDTPMMKWLKSGSPIKKT